MDTLSTLGEPTPDGLSRLTEDELRSRCPGLLEAIARGHTGAIPTLASLRCEIIGRSAKMRPTWAALSGLAADVDPAGGAERCGWDARRSA